MGFRAQATTAEIATPPDKLTWRRVRHYADQKAADRLLRRNDLPEGVRRELVERIRSQIAAGTYESKQKLDIAVDRLIADL